MQLHKRVERLEAKVAPVGFKMVHLVGVLSGQSHDEAGAAYGVPIGEDDEVIFLVGVEPAVKEVEQ
jgi:hypothetical protein